MVLKFSIIIPVYNVAQYVSDCLDSVLAQTIPDWECVCVDDGSTDDSGMILDAYAQRDSRVRVIHQSNGGVARARNAALDAISGEWFLFLDADDVWSPHLLEVCQAGIAFEPAATIIQFGDRHFAENEQCHWDDALEKPHFERVDLSRHYSRRWLSYFAPEKAFKRALYSDIRQRPYCVGEDLLYMTECALRSHVMLKTHLRLYGYRDRRNSVTRTGVSKRKIIDRIRSNVDIVNLFEASGREIGRETRRELCNVLTESIASEYMQLPLDEREYVRQQWLSALHVLNASALPYGFQKIRTCLMSRFKNDWVWFLLAHLPRRLKELGLHR